MYKHIITLLILAALSLTYCNAKEYCTVADQELCLRNRPGNHTKITHRLGKSARLEYAGNDGFWAKVVFKGDTCYARLNSLSFSEDVAATLPAWVNLDETHGKWGSLGYYFSTDRIMEALPDFNILKNRTLLPPDRCFRIALGLLEIMYVFGSPDPLGFCDINNVWWPKAWLYVFLIALGLFGQMKLTNYILFVVQSDRDYDYKAGWWTKIPLFGVLYFIIWVVGYYFDFKYPPLANIIAGLVLCLPVIAMLIRSFINLDAVSVIVAAPFYIITTAAILALYCLVGMAIAVLTVIDLVLMLCGEDEIYGKIGGQWYKMNYAYFSEHRLEITDDFVVTPFDRFLE